METEKAEIIGYRFGERFVCPICYEKSLEILRVHKIAPPVATAIKEGETKNFICQTCEETRDLIQSLKEEKKLKGKRSKENATIVSRNLEKIISGKQFIESEIDMIGEIAKLNRKLKFIKKTVQCACEGRPLNRKNIPNFRDFLNRSEKDLDAIRSMITLSFFIGLEYHQMLAQETRRLFCALRPKEQELLRARFGNASKRKSELSEKREKGLIMEKQQEANE